MIRVHPENKAFNELVVVDLDSTLADTRHRHHLSPFVDTTSSWPQYAKGCVNDTPIAGAITLVNLLWNHYGIYILSGRDGAAITETRWWLSRHDVMYDFLKLRDPEDVEDNGVYKARHIDWLKDNGYKVHLLIDDWPQVIQTVEDAGTPGLCVNPRYVDQTMAGYAAQLKVDNV